MKTNVTQYRNISLEEFVREFALMLTDRRAIQVGLMMILGDDQQQCFLLACHGDENLWNLAIQDLKRLGFVKTEEVH